MNVLASCNLYVDNIFTGEFNNILAFNSNQLLTQGLHDYFIYCFVNPDENGTVQFELTNVTQINVIEGEPAQVDFIFSSSEFIVSDFPLFMITPCVNKGIYLPLVNKPYPQIATGEVYFAPVVNTVSSFNLTAGEYEFCLIHGYGQYNVANGFSTEWHINQVFRQLEIGTYDIPSNVTKTFLIGLETSDLYKVSDPKWWNTSWVAIITGLIGVALGLVLIAVGVIMKLPQAIVIGGIVALISLGFQITPLILGIVT